MHACDRQTDRRTDRITTPKTALAYARAVKTDSLVPCIEVMQGWITFWNVIWIGRGERLEMSPGQRLSSTDDGVFQINLSAQYVSK